MNKKIVTIALIALVVLFAGIGTSMAKDNKSSQGNEYKEFKEKVEKVKSEKKNKKYIVIDDQEYSKKDFIKSKADHKLFKDLRKEQVSEEKMKKEFVKQKVLLNEAKKQNLSISKEKAQTYADKVRKQISKSQNAEQIKEIGQKYRDSLGLTEEEYWESLVPKYQELLAIGELKNKYINEYIKDNSSSHRVAAQAWEKHADKLAEKATVKMNK
ncbi:hypothetical protein JI666_15365 [Bacillus sp. NTK071]|uniref:hypothetical protein n=1 Tax=Bacillus sp. NTK071 TaxID=2802175 RepID=UPI001A8F9504|nr:hypothetical protein [Bacillus sp. NTK071]MBN8210132.1 hypothetical protein [Bacillus sp. NTK071]